MKYQLHFGSTAFFSFNENKISTSEPKYPDASFERNISSGKT